MALKKKKNNVLYIIHLQHYFFLASQFAFALNFLFLGPNQPAKFITIEKQDGT